MVTFDPQELQAVLGSLPECVLESWWPQLPGLHGAGTSPASRRQTVVLKCGLAGRPSHSAIALKPAFGDRLDVLKDREREGGIKTGSEVSLTAGR